MISFTTKTVIQAPPSLAFDCWVNPVHFVRWFPPAECASTLLQADVRPGGLYVQEDRWPDGGHFFMKHAFREISPDDRLVFVTGFCSETFQSVNHPHAPLWPEKLLTTVAFEEVDEDTQITVTWEPFEVPDDQAAFFSEHLDWCQGGWKGTFDRLAHFVESLRAITS